MSGGIEDYSPWQTGLGRYANMVRIALGEERGYIELHVYGAADVYKPGDEQGEYSFRFTPEDGPMLIELGRELENMKEEYASHLREQAAEPELFGTNAERKQAEKTHGSMLTESKQPRIVANGNKELNQFALK